MKPVLTITPHHGVEGSLAPGATLTKEMGLLTIVGDLGGGKLGEVTGVDGVRDGDGNLLEPPSGTVGFTFKMEPAPGEGGATIDVVIKNVCPAASSETSYPYTVTIAPDGFATVFFAHGHFDNDYRDPSTVSITVLGDEYTVEVAGAPEGQTTAIADVLDVDTPLTAFISLHYTAPSTIQNEGVGRPYVGIYPYYGIGPTEDIANTWSGGYFPSPIEPIEAVIWLKTASLGLVWVRVIINTDSEVLVAPGPQDYYSKFFQALGYEMPDDFFAGFKFGLVTGAGTQGRVITENSLTISAASNSIYVYFPDPQAGGFEQLVSGGNSDTLAALLDHPDYNPDGTPKGPGDEDFVQSFAAFSGDVIPYSDDEPENEGHEENTESEAGEPGADLFAFDEPLFGIESAGQNPVEDDGVTVAGGCYDADETMSATGEIDFLIGPDAHFLDTLLNAHTLEDGTRHIHVALDAGSPHTDVFLQADGDLNLTSMADLTEKLGITIDNDHVSLDEQWEAMTEQTIDGNDYMQWQHHNTAGDVDATILVQKSILENTQS